MLKAASSPDKLNGSQIKALFNIWGEIGEKSVSCLSGFSMWPFIRPGDTLVIDHQVNDIKLGEIVIFHNQGKLVAHRVVKRIETSSDRIVYLTKGDHNRKLDYPALSSEAILGKMAEINSPIGKIDCSSLLWRVLNYLIAISSLTIAGFFCLMEKKV